MTFTPLMLAAHSGDPDRVRKELNKPGKGGCVNTQHTNTGLTALMIAAIQYK